ncbi:unnamed protein product [Tetraodon nigroviridis]|nr:unnamed protein product [Tetraodon nigroviridis]
METFSHCVPHPFCQNRLSPETPGQQVGTLSQVGSKDHNVSTVKVSVEQILKRPFAQLIGSNGPVRKDNVVEWEHTGGEASTSRMNYSRGRLQVQEEGYYYLFSKLTFNASEQCKLVQHKVMKVTRAYGKPIELMRSKSSRCTKTTSTSKSSPEEDLRNSFLAGIFHLQRRDEIYVTLEDIQKLHRGVIDNLLGAFMIAS